MDIDIQAIIKSIDEGKFGDSEKADKAKVDRDLFKANKLKKDSLTLQIKQIQLDKEKIRLAMLQKRQQTQGGGIGVGGVAAGTAMGIALIKSLRSVASSSMILSTTLNFINKLLGLLVDFVLLPFIQPLVDNLLNLANAIVTFSAWWDAKFPQNPITNKGAEAGKAAVSGNLGFDPLQLTAQIAGALVGGIVGFLIGGPGGALIGAAIVSILSGSLVNWAYGAGAVVSGFLYTLGYNFMKWLREQNENLRIALRGFLSWLYNGVIQIFTDMFNFIQGLLEKIPGYKESKAVAQGVKDFVGGKNIGDVIVQVSGTVFKDEVDLYQSIVSKLRTEIFRFFPSG